MLNIVDQHLQRLPVHGLNLIMTGIVQVQHPHQDILLLHQISRVHSAELVPVESQGRQHRQIVFLLDSIVRCLDKVNILLLALIINVLQLVDNLLALLVSLAV